MKKTKKVESVEDEKIVPPEEDTCGTCNRIVINKLELSTGRADFDQIVGKLNEVIDKLNGN